MSRILLALAASLAWASCGPINPAPVEPSGLGGAPGTGGAAGFGGSTASPCQQAQETLEFLRCPEAYTAKDRPFVEVCEIAAADGRDWHPLCIAKITDCSQVDAAYRGERCQ